VVAYIKTCNH